MMLIFHWGGSDKADRGLKQGALRLYYINSPELFGDQRWPPWGSDISSESWRWVAVGQEDPNGDANTCKGCRGSHTLEGPPAGWRDWTQRAERVLCRAMISRKEQTHWPCGLVRILALEPQDSVLRILDLGSDGPDCVVVASSLL